MTKYLDKCLFPAAGFGTRFLPATKSMPKELMPIVNKPLLHYAVEEAIDANISQMGIIYGKQKTAIPNYFDENIELDEILKNSGKEQFLDNVKELMDSCTFIYMRQRQMLGLGHAILTGKPMINEHNFGVILADDLCVSTLEHNALRQLSDVHFEYGERCVVAVERVPKDMVSRYGVISGTEISPGVWEVDKMVEKPSVDEAPTNLAVIGRYILRHGIFDELENTAPDKSGEIQLTSALNAMAKKGLVVAYEFKGRRFDCGQIEGFIEANNFCYEHSYKK